MRNFISVVVVISMLIQVIITKNSNEETSCRDKKNPNDPFICNKSPEDSINILVKLRYSIGDIEPPEHISVNVANNSYVIQALEIAAANKRYRFSALNYGPTLGFFVTSYDGIEQIPEHSLYWLYYIQIGSEEPVLADKGISSFVLNQDTNIIFVLKTSN